MSRHGFGKGEYKYFAYPLPETIQYLRTNFYRTLAPIANRWNEAMRVETRYPETHSEFLQRCHSAGQTRATASFSLCTVVPFRGRAASTEQIFDTA